MKTVEQVSLQGVIFAFETDAKKAIDTYLHQANTSLTGNDAQKEVVSDLELSIASHLKDAGFGRDRAVNVETVQGILTQLGPVDGDTAAGTRGESNWNNFFREPLVKDRSNAVMFGICGGLAERAGIDAIWFRMIFIVLFFMTGGAFFLVYIVVGILLDMTKTKSPYDMAVRAHSKFKQVSPYVGWRGVLCRIDKIVRQVLRATLRIVSVAGIVASLITGTVGILMMLTSRNDIPYIGMNRSVLAYVLVLSGVGIACWLFGLLMQISFFPEYRLSKSVKRMLAWIVPIVILSTAFVTSALYLKPEISDWRANHSGEKSLIIDF